MLRGSLLLLRTGRPHRTEGTSCCWGAPRSLGRGPHSLEALLRRLLLLLRRRLHGSLGCTPWGAPLGLGAPELGWGPLL